MSRAGAVQWFQLYVEAQTKDGKRDATARVIKEAKESGFAALCVTVDRPMLGRREQSMRIEHVKRSRSKVQTPAIPTPNLGKTSTTDRDVSMTWKTIHEFHKLAGGMKIVLKGIQRGDDAVLAAESNVVDAIITSNHGGRQLDYARSGLKVLAEVMTGLKEHFLKKQQPMSMQVFMDGGIRRRTDIFKALALGCDGLGSAAHQCGASPRTVR